MRGNSIRQLRLTAQQMLDQLALVPHPADFTTPPSASRSAATLGKNHSRRTVKSQAAQRESPRVACRRGGINRERVRFDQASGHANGCANTGDRSGIIINNA
jgi:hypothetical protein